MIRQLILLFLLVAGIVLFAVNLAGKDPTRNYPALAALGLIVSTAAAIAYVRREDLANRRRVTIQVVFVLLSCGGFAAILDPVFDGARLAADRAKCHENIRELIGASILYIEANDERLPPARRWRSLTDKAPTPVACPQAKTPWSYAMNSAMSLRDPYQIEAPAKTVLLFEMDAHEKDAAGGRDQQAVRHHSSPYVGFADGHAKGMYKPRAEDVRWKP